MDSEDRSASEDPIDILVSGVPKQIWLTVGIIAIMLLIRLLIFDKASAPATPTGDAAADETMEGRVVEILEETTAEEAQQGQLSQRVLVQIMSGSQQGRTIEIDHGATTMITKGNLVRIGDRVLIERTVGSAGERFYISDFIRLPMLALVLAAFCVAAIVVGRRVGLRALVSMGIGIFAIAYYIVPGILSGYDPLLVCITGSLCLMTASLYLTYQWTWKTHVAFFSLGVSLVATGLVAALFTRMVHLTGLGSEDAAFLIQVSSVRLDLQGLLLGGIVLGALGVLDDVTIGQSSSIFELKRANPALLWRELFSHGMTIGRDHIASMINTLLLAYVGASLPLFLLLASQNLSMVQTFNREFLAEEIIRTLAGSMGLLLAVPVTSLIASIVAQTHGLQPEGAAGEVETQQTSV